MLKKPLTSSVDARTVSVLSGALGGYTFLDYDDNAITSALGMMAGAALGSVLDLSIDKEALKVSANRSIGNVSYSVPKEFIESSNSKTFNELKDAVLKRARGVAKLNDKYNPNITSFSRDDINTTLNSNTFAEFEKELKYLESEEALRRFDVALKSGNRNISVNQTDIIPERQKIVSTFQIKKTATLAEKQQAFRQYLSKEGYSLGEIDRKLLTMSSIFESATEDIEITDRVIKIGNENIKLTQAFGDPLKGTRMVGHISNDNFFITNKVNPLGRAITQGVTVDDILNALPKGVNKAEVEAELINGFNIHGLLQGTDGLAPDEAYGLIKRLASIGNFEADEVLEQLNTSYQYSGPLSSKVKQLRQQGHTAITSNDLETTQYAARISNTLEFGNTIKTKIENGQLVIPQTDVLGSIGQTSPSPGTPSEMKQISKIVTERTGRLSYNTNADKMSQIFVDDRLNRPWTEMAAFERNAGTVNNREEVTRSTHRTTDLAKRVFKKTSGSMQYGSSVTVQSYSIDPESEIKHVDANGNKSSVRLADIFTRRYGATSSTGDGFGLIKQSVAKEFFISEGISTNMRANDLGQFKIISRVHRGILDGSITMDDALEKAKLGALRLNTRHQKAVSTAKQQLQDLQNLNNSSATSDDYFKFLQNSNNRIKNKFKDVNMYLASNRDFTGDLNDELQKIDFLKNEAKKSVMKTAVRGVKLSRGVENNLHPQVEQTVAQYQQNLKTFESRLMYGSGVTFDDSFKFLESLEQVIETSSNSKEFTRAMFPVAGQLLGYANDGSLVEVPKAYTHYTTSGLFVNNREASGGLYDSVLGFNFDGTYIIGEQEFVKGFGVSAKEQGKIEQDAIVNKRFIVNELNKSGSLSILEENGNLNFELTGVSGNVYRLTEDEMFDGKLSDVLLDKYKNNMTDEVKADYQQLKNLEARADKIHTISEEGGAGTKLGNKLEKSLLAYAKAYESGDQDKMNAVLKKIEIDSPAIKAHIVGEIENAVTQAGSFDNMDKKIAKGLSNFVMGTSYDRASIDYLMSAHLGHILGTEKYFEPIQLRRAALNNQSIPDVAKQVYQQELNMLYSGLEDTLLKSNVDKSIVDDILNRTKTALGTQFSAIQDDATNAVIDSLVKPFMSNMQLDNTGRSNLLPRLIQARENFDKAKQANPDLVALSQDELRELSDYYVRATQIIPEQYKDVVFKQAAFGLSMDYTSGSGKLGKNLSWNASAVLIHNGFTQEEIKHVGKFKAEELADLESVIMLRDKTYLGINNLVEQGREKAFLQALQQTPTKRRDALIQALNMDPNDFTKEKHAVTGYNLLSNRRGYASIPITLEDSNLFGSYTNEHGIISQKQISKVSASIIEQDLMIRKLMRDGASQQEVDMQFEELEKRIDSFERLLADSLGGQDNILKKVFTRMSTHGSYKDVIPIQGIVNELSKNKLDEFGNLLKAGESVVGMDSKSLIGMYERTGILEQHGISSSNVDDAIKQLKSLGYLEAVESDGPIKHQGFRALFSRGLNGEEKVPLFTLVSREPVVGAGSIRVADIILDESLAHIEGEKVVYIGADDLLYQKTQIGDFDLDHAFTYEVLRKGGMTVEQAAEFRAKGEDITHRLQKLQDFISTLGVKGKDKDVIKTLDGVVQYSLNNGDIDDTTNLDEVEKQAVEYLRLTKQKSGERKVIAPIATKIAVDLIDSLHGMKNLDAERRIAASMIIHYGVENLIKSQHLDTKKYAQNPVTPAETLNLLLYGKHGNLTPNQFKDQFKQLTLNPILENINAKQDKSRKSLEELLAQNKITQQVFDRELDIVETTRKDYISMATNAVEDALAELSASRNDVPISPIHQQKVKAKGDNVAKAIDGITKAARGDVGSSNTERLPMDPNPVKAFEELGLVDQMKYEYNTSKSAIGQVLSNNKMLLAGAGAAAAVGALMLQSKPDFETPKPKARPENMLHTNSQLDPSKSIYEDTGNNYNHVSGTHKPSEYIKRRPSEPTFVGIDAQSLQEGFTDMGTQYNNIDQILFGGGISSARITHHLSGEY